MSQRMMSPLDVTFDEVSNLQCPNCGQYRVKNVTSSGWLLNSFLALITLGLWLIVWGISSLFSKPKKTLDLRCKLCGYCWSVPKDSIAG